MLSEREVQRLHEIEVHLHLSDPRFVEAFAVLSGKHVHTGATPLLSTLLVFTLLVLIGGTFTAHVPTVLVGLVLATVALGLVAAAAGPAWSIRGRA